MRGGKVHRVVETVNGLGLLLESVSLRLNFTQVHLAHCERLLWAGTW